MPACEQKKRKEKFVSFYLMAFHFILFLVIFFTECGVAALQTLQNANENTAGKMQMSDRRN